MKVIFEMSANYKEAYTDITMQCSDLCKIEEKENLNGDQIIAIVAIVTPVVWELIKRYLSDPQITIEVQLDDQTTATISSRSIERAKMKVDRLKAEWEKAKITNK